ncbi:hypothetical protein Tco_0522724 [Tanacetum coccineum]
MESRSHRITLIGSSASLAYQYTPKYLRRSQLSFFPYSYWDPQKVEPIPGMRPANSHIDFQTMAEPFSKMASTEQRAWKIGSSSSNDGLAALGIEQLTEELCSRKEKSEQAKVVIVEQEGPSSPKKLKNLRGISFLSDSQEENTIDQLPM